MEIGVHATCTDETLRPDEVAVLVEQAGIDALHFGEHSHIPVGRDSESPAEGMPREWARLPDLLIALTTAALATTRLRVSSAVIQLALREPITTAKALATIDVLSRGRLDLIVGHGAITEQMRNHGVDPGTRYDLVRERMLAMREIWREEEASFHGKFVRFDSILSWPKPVQPGGVPLFFGGNSPGSEERALEYGDGWAPLALAGVPDRIRTLRNAGHQLRVVAVGVPTDRAGVEEYAAAGADRIVFRLASAMPGEIERSLDEVRSAAAAVV
ncbi:TIGR03619 family F420-dependent LLM class oxidoreductase [Actinomycetospora atypica]|uniref:TIGR03619 family F420-dependent LLM class oxidoreductase n=1 Tax=Actinomycetospora atypica TaxID=1290095 RepID=A0ABV9YSE2_9PSEU